MSLTSILSIDVKQYGALGDGSTDDTASITAAVAAIVNATQTISIPAGQVYLATTPTLYFPPGIYVISATIDMPQAIKILGDNAILVPLTIAKGTFNAFSFATTYDVTIERMTFTEFDTAIEFPGNNLDSSKIAINGCVIRSNNTGILLGSVSTLSNIINSKFYNNKIAVNIVSADSVSIRDCWISAGIMQSPSSPQPGDEVRPAQIINHGLLNFENNLLVPAEPESGTIEPAWINNYFCVKAINNRQGGEPGSFTLINNFASTEYLVSGGPAPTSVIVKDSNCYAVYGNVGRTPNGLIYAQPAAVRFIAIPNLTVVNNNVGLVDCKLIDYSLYAYNDTSAPYIFDPAKISAMISASNASVGITAIEVSNNSGPYLVPQGYDPQTVPNSYVPEQLHPFVRSNESLWPYRRRPLLPLKTATSVGNFSTYEFDISESFFHGVMNRTYLLKFSGNPLLSGSGLYSGGVVGLLRVNGTYISQNLRFGLVYVSLLNQIATPGSFLSGSFNVDVKWKSSLTDPDPTLLLFTSLTQTNQQFVVEITGADAAFNLELIILDEL